MSVSLNPSSVLGFNRPFTQSVKRTLQISNHNAQPVAFKVKTTAPKLYCVRPNSGRVEPGETVEVAVMLQAMKEDLPINTKCKDKFLIQSTIITPEKESLPLPDIWNAEGDGVHSQKIRVAYLPPEGQSVPEEDETNANLSSLLVVPGQDNYATVRQAPPFTNGHATREPSGGEESTIQAPQPEEVHHDAPSTPPHVTVYPPEPPAEEPPSDEGVGIVNVSVHAPPAHASPPPSPPTRPAPIPDPNPELVKKLEEAQAEIERLRQLIASMPEPSTVPTTITTPPELRSRRRAPYSDDGSSTYDGRTTYGARTDYDDRTTYDGQTDVGSYVGSEVPPPEGVPLQVVVIVALAVFVTTYLFF